MYGTEQVSEQVAQPGRPANDDFGVRVAHDLWDLTDSIGACADFSEGRDRYESSVFRFTADHRRLYAALIYVDAIGRLGHHGYFATSLAYGFDDAMTCFAAMGAIQVVENARHAAIQAQGVRQTVGTAVMPETDMTDCDLNLAAAKPVAILRGFARRYAWSFDRW